MATNFLNNKDIHAQTKTQLNEIELNFLLQFIAASGFKGENVKILNSIVEKLEQQLNG